MMDAPWQGASWGGQAGGSGVAHIFSESPLVEGQLRAWGARNRGAHRGGGWTLEQPLLNPGSVCLAGACLLVCTCLALATIEENPCHPLLHHLFESKPEGGSDSGSQDCMPQQPGAGKAHKERLRLWLLVRSSLGATQSFRQERVPCPADSPAWDTGQLPA